uniref:Scol-BPFTx n=1 Tax=Hemiscolopendra marginata TaxID=943146 RepID=A0A646QFN0_9MYRI
MVQYASILILFCNIYLTSGIEQFIERWRNEPRGNIEFYRGSQIGRTYDLQRARIEPSPSIVQCIENLRNDDSNTRNSGIIQFNKAFEFFGRCFCHKVLEQSDINRCHASIDYNSKELSYRHFQRFKIRQVLGALKYFEQSNLPEKKENVFIKTITNRGSKSVKSTAVLTFTKTNSISTTSSNEIGGSVGGSAELNLGIFSVKTEIEATYSYARSQGKTEEDTETFSLEREFDIPAQSSVQIICSLKKQDFDLAWEIPVIVNGSVAVKMDGYNEDGSSEYLFVDVKYVARYFKEFSLTRDNPPMLQGFIRGRTQGSKNYDAEVNPQTLPLTVTPVQKDLCNPLPSKV